MNTITSSKITDLAGLLEVIAKWREHKESIVFTNGVFDILHAGHLQSLEQAAGFGKRLIVAVNSNKSVRTLGKGPGRPVNDEEDRARLLAGLSVVDAVVVFDEATPYELLSQILPDVLVKGSDYKLNEIVGREFAGRVERIELLKGFSTTSLIERIKNLEIN